MPRATVNTVPVRRELKSCPGGYVMLRQLPYGDVLVRRDGASRLSFEQQEMAEDPRMLMETMISWAREFEFRTCIVEHNLEDESGNALDFTQSAAIRSLDPSIGKEIESLIDELNGESDEQKTEDFTRVASLSSEAELALVKPVGGTDEN